MKRFIFTFLILNCLNSFGQIKPGTYDEISDTLFMGKGWILSYSQIIINSDKTFAYHHRTSEGCLLWYDIKGSWRSKGNKLYFSDTILSTNIASPNLPVYRTNVFTIQKDILHHTHCFFDDERAGDLKTKGISGNFILKRE